MVKRVQSQGVSILHPSLRMLLEFVFIVIV